MPPPPPPPRSDSLLLPPISLCTDELIRQSQERFDEATIAALHAISRAPAIKSKTVGDAEEDSDNDDKEPVDTTVLDTPDPKQRTSSFAKIGEGFKALGAKAAKKVKLARAKATGEVLEGTLEKLHTDCRIVSGLSSHLEFAPQTSTKNDIFSLLTQITTQLAQYTQSKYKDKTALKIAQQLGYRLLMFCTQYELGSDKLNRLLNAEATPPGIDSELFHIYFKAILELSKQQEGQAQAHVLTKESKNPLIRELRAILLLHQDRKKEAKTAWRTLTGKDPGAEDSTFDLFAKAAYHLAGTNKKITGIHQDLPADILMVLAAQGDLRALTKFANLCYNNAIPGDELETHWLVIAMRYFKTALTFSSKFAAWDNERTLKAYAAGRVELAYDRITAKHRKGKKDQGMLEKKKKILMALLLVILARKPEEKPREALEWLVFIKADNIQHLISEEWHDLSSVQLAYLKTACQNALEKFSKKPSSSKTKGADIDAHERARLISQLKTLLKNLSEKCLWQSTPGIETGTFEKLIKDHFSVMRERLGAERKAQIEVFSAALEELRMADQHCEAGGEATANNQMAIRVLEAKDALQQLALELLPADQFIFEMETLLEAANAGTLALANAQQVFDKLNPHYKAQCEALQEKRKILEAKLDKAEMESDSETIPLQDRINKLTTLHKTLSDMLAVSAQGAAAGLAVSSSPTMLHHQAAEAASGSGGEEEFGLGPANYLDVSLPDAEEWRLETSFMKLNEGKTTIFRGNPFANPSPWPPANVQKQLAEVPLPPAGATGGPSTLTPAAETSSDEDSLPPAPRTTAPTVTTT